VLVFGCCFFTFTVKAGSDEPPPKGYYLFGGTTLSLYRVYGDSKIEVFDQQVGVPVAGFPFYTEAGYQFGKLLIGVFYHQQNISRSFSSRFGASGTEQKTQFAPGIRFAYISNGGFTLGFRGSFIQYASKKSGYVPSESNTGAVARQVFMGFRHTITKNQFIQAEGGLGKPFYFLVGYGWLFRK
jgi:hypothetical protein